MFVVVVLQMCFMCIRVMSISIEDSQQGRKFVLMSGWWVVFSSSGCNVNGSGAMIGFEWLFRRKFLGGGDGRWLECINAN